MQTRPALFYQGLLLGLFINGVMRWGFDSIIQTPSALGETGGSQGGSWWGATSPNVTAVVGEGARNISFHWGEMPIEKEVDGVSILVDDVERWRGYVDAELYWDKEGVTLGRAWGRPEPEQAEDGERRAGESKREGEQWEEPEFYRFAWMKGDSAGRYGGVGIWDERGEWIPIRDPRVKK